MPILLLLLAADPYAARLLAEVNAARVIAGVNPVLPSDTLSEAASLEAEWTAHALRRKLPFELHLTDTAWLLDQRPDLDWPLLLATYQGDLPDQLGIFDVARLCGYEGTCKDNIGRANQKPVNAVIGWLGSQDHRENLLDPDWVECGTGSAGGGQGAVCVAVFGRPSE